MRRSKEATAESRQKILVEAARLYRQKGFDGVGVADIMAAAGMTHGGFYRHFPSKEALIAEAMAKAFADRAATLEGGDGAPGPDLVKSYVDMYLSPGHVGHPELGCPMAAVGSEAAHIGDAVSQAFRDGAERILSPIADSLRGGKDQRPAALRLVAMLVGAVVIARACGDKAFEAEILAAIRDDPTIRKVLQPKPGASTM